MPAVVLRSPAPLRALRANAVKAPRTRRCATAGSAAVSAPRATISISIGGTTTQRRGALVVRRDGIDEAAELSIAGPASNTGPTVSTVVPKLPRSSCAAVIEQAGGFNLATTSFGTIGLGVGVPLLVYGFFGFFNFLPGGSVTSLLLIYGFIISLIGFALKYAQLDPLLLVTFEDALALRETQTTAILTQVRNDVTRFRYGDEQHLEEGLALIFRYNRPGGLRKNQAPLLVGLKEQVIVDRYALVLEFDSPKMELNEWTDRREKIQAFFGPGVTCGITEIEEGKVEIELVSDGSNVNAPSAGEMDDMEVLPPLMPGLPPRYVKRGKA